MEVSKPIEISRIEELTIIQNVRIIHRHDLNPVISQNNLRVQFEMTGEIRGGITCYLCLDGHELSVSEKNYLFPLFVEAMNILIGRQITLDEEISHFNVRLSSPKLNMIPTPISTSARGMTHKYELELESSSFCVLAEYSLETIN
ncbi:MAG TPA: hypothetical protein VNJ08_00380 [Bacteriovoracaceae bacterium]|nr:hypothetical protein [Bacteriovoracaceae bacterium]